MRGMRRIAGCTKRGASQMFDPPFAHKYPDLHRNKGLATTGFCGMILSTEEQSSRRREQNEAVRRGGNAAQGAHGKPGVPAGSRATGVLRTAANMLTRQMG